MYAIGKGITDQITKENFEAVFVVVVVVNACILDSSVVTIVEFHSETGEFR